MKLISDHKFTEGTEILPGSHIKPVNLSLLFTTPSLPPPVYPPITPHPPIPTRFQAPVAFFYSADERDCLGLALMNWHYY